MRKVNSENGYIGMLFGVELVFIIIIFFLEVKFRYGYVEGIVVFIFECLFNDILLVMEVMFFYNNSYYYLYCS